MRVRGRIGSVHIENSILIFKEFCTVRADCFCPLGSKGYFEVDILHESAETQWGFCTDAFDALDQYCREGVGDDANSWGVDGDRGVLWHCGQAGQYLEKWHVGDVIGLACDLSKQSDVQIFVSVNGNFSHPNGVVFNLPERVTGLYAALTSKSGCARIRLGGGLVPLVHGPPDESFKAMAAFGPASTRETVRV